MSETTPEVTPEQAADLDFQRRLAAGAGSGDFHLSEADLAADAQAKAAEAGDEDADFARRLAAGTGGGDFHLTEADIKANEAVQAQEPAVTPYVDPAAQGSSSLTPEQQATIAATNPTPSAPEPQAPSQPGPTTPSEPVAT